MLAKCANPSCSHVFRYFGAGRLYRLKRTQHGRQFEHFWLCPDCAPVMTIAIETNDKPVVIPRTRISAYREVVGRVSWMPEVSPSVLARKSPVAMNHL